MFSLEQKRFVNSFKSRFIRHSKCEHFLINGIETFSSLFLCVYLRIIYSSVFGFQIKGMNLLSNFIHAFLHTHTHQQIKNRIHQFTYIWFHFHFQQLFSSSFSYSQQTWYIFKIDNKKPFAKDPVNMNEFQFKVPFFPFTLSHPHSLWTWTMKHLSIARSKKKKEHTWFACTNSVCKCCGVFIGFFYSLVFCSSFSNFFPSNHSFAIVSVVTKTNEPEIKMECHIETNINWVIFIDNVSQLNLWMIPTQRFWAQ